MLRSILIALFLSGLAVAQEPETVQLPDSVMSQVVNRIVRYQFKPSRTARTIPIAETTVKQDWLPAIPNVTFKLVSDNDIINYEKGVFLFERVTLDGNTYSINVGWGGLDCDASGDTWKFTIRDEKVRLWPTGGGWGRGCGGNSPPVVRGLKIGDVSPNELPGYEFFKKGKLKGIRLGISTREDMKRIFGDECTGTCDYDDKWNLWVNYFESDRPSYLNEYTEIDGIRYLRSPKAEFVNTLRFVNLRPKKMISFVRVVFPRTFGRESGYSIGDAWGENGFEGAVHTRTYDYVDGYGLSYKIYDEETFNNLRSKPDPEEKRFQKGDLIEIEYWIPNELEDTIYDKIPKPKSD